MATKLFRYTGPKVFVVALDRDIEAGDEVYGPDQLQYNNGFEIIKEPSSKKAVVNDKDDAKNAAVGGSGEQTEADH
jgi:hypothetical protein